MNLLIIILSLILFYGNYIYGLETEELDGIDVLTKLKNIQPDCDLHDFLRVDDEYKTLTDDLRKHCSSSNSVKRHRILCHMLSYELEKACRLTPNLRPSKVIYATSRTPSQICNLNNILLTDEWIWHKITDGGQKKIGVNAKKLCTKVTSDTDTLRLARFFYKTAPRVRQVDSSKQSKDKLQSNANNKVLTEPSSGAVKNDKDVPVDTAQTEKEKAQQSSDINTKKTDETVDGLKEKAAQTVEGIKEKAAKVGEGIKEKVGQVGEGLKEKAAQAGEGIKEKTAQTAEELKDKVSQSVETIKVKTGQATEETKDKAGERTKEKTTETGDDTKDKAAEGTKEKTGETGDGTNDKTGEGTKDKAGEGTNDKTGEGTKDKASEGTKEKTGQTGEGAKDKANEGTKEKTAETGEGTKDKASEGAKEKTNEGTKDKADEGTKEKTDEGTKDKASEGTKEKPVQSGEGTKDKADQTVEGEKAKVNTGPNALSDTTNKTGDQTQGGLEKPKQSGEESLVPKTTEGTKLLKDATNELSPKTDDKSQKILDLNKDKTPESEKKKDQENTDNVDNDDDVNNGKETKTNGQFGQILKPDLSIKTDEEKDGNKTIESTVNKTKDVGETTENKTSNLADEDADKLNSNKNNESGNRILSLTNLMKQYNISLVQLIELIKNNQLKLVENRKNSSLINSTTSSDPLIEHKTANTLDLLTSTLSTLSNAPSSSIKIYSLEINRYNGEKNKDKNKNDGDEAKPDDRNEGSDEDQVKNEEAEKQLQKQQKESDKNDYQSAVDNKGKPEDNEHKSQDDYGTDNGPDQQIETGDPPNNDEDAEYQGTDVGPNGMILKKPTDEDRNVVEKVPEKDSKIPSSGLSRTGSKIAPSRKYTDDDGWSGSFVTYFLVFTLFVVVGYLVLHNKNKLMAYVVEGRRSGASRTGSRPSHRGYEKLININDIIPIDNTNPLTDKEAIILKT
ncbi:unnamed protein product [Rotaria sordida]|uniref:Trans-Golgi network integral membrane protein 2 n=1 Tax=Rotaria sordida TaxID=392033 RepID=A0A814JD66_9BILA|nr:unnamed protein product [Rotaria sordida]